MVSLEYRLLPMAGIKVGVSVSSLVELPAGIKSLSGTDAPFFSHQSERWPRVEADHFKAAARGASRPTQSAIIRIQRGELLL